MRIIKLLCLTDGYMYPRKENGVTKDGEDTQSRSSVRRALETRLECDGGLSMPAFVLAEAPPPSTIKDDPIDRLMRNTDGAWNLGTPAWHAEKDRRCAARAARTSQAVAMVRAQTASSVVDGLASLIKGQPSPSLESPTLTTSKATK
jgi:hypothetical protein